MSIPFKTLQELIEEDMKALQRYRRALRREDQVFFDEITSHIQKHMLACTQADHLLPIEIFLFTIMLEQQKEISSLKYEIDRATEKSKSTPDRPNLKESSSQATEGSKPTEKTIEEKPTGEAGPAADEG